MALAPQFISHRLGSSNAKHTLEVYVDYVCPFSAKIIKSIRENLLPSLESSPQTLAIVLRQQPQPWHSSSTIVHEAGVAVSRLAPSKFWDFTYALMECQTEYFDEATAHEAPYDTRRRLAKLANKSVGIEEKAFLDLVDTGKGNAGNKVGADLKYQVRLGRQNSIHVTPTVVLDGSIDNSVSSSFGKDEWKKYVDEKLK